MQERNWRKLFGLSLIIKEIDGILQLIGGLVLLFVSSNTINTVALYFIQRELSGYLKSKKRLLQQASIIPRS